MGVAELNGLEEIKMGVAELNCLEEIKMGRVRNKNEYF